MAWTLSHPHPGSNFGSSYIKSCGLQLRSPQSPLFLPPPRGEPQAGQASPDTPITLTVLLDHTVPYPAPATLSLTPGKIVFRETGP